MDTKREHRTHVEGSPRGNPYDLTYSPSGRMTTKYCDNGSVTMVKTVDMAYGYCDNDQPHAVRRMYDHHTHRHFDLRWDPAGNLGQVSATGKELDAETGYSYFGARYYAPAVLTAWLSVDPMSDKYPSISPYAY